LRRGWFGNSQGHSLAAKGIRLYARKQQLSDPSFFARREESVPYADIVSMVGDGRSYPQLVVAFPDADKEDLRLRGIKAVESRDGHGTLSMINSSGVDQIVVLSRANPALGRRVRDVLDDRQRSSFIHGVKVGALRGRLDDS
jgi:hypothetical protein